MTDAHCHVVRDASRHFLCGEGGARSNDVVFVGFHPWQFLAQSWSEELACSLEAQLAAHAQWGVGEIGLDRLKVRVIPAAMRRAFEAQLELAARWHRPVVLHGARCWGEVVASCRSFAGKIPAFLLHGFSRAEGLLNELVALNGFVSVGPAVMNEHAVNYRALVSRLPLDRLLVESDCTLEQVAQVPSVEVLARQVAALRSMPFEAFQVQVERNAEAFVRSLTGSFLV